MTAWGQPRPIPDREGRAGSDPTLIPAGIGCVAPTAVAKGLADARVIVRPGLIPPSLLAGADEVIE
jgi:hypothetical protein